MCVSRSVYKNIFDLSSTIYKKCYLEPGETPSQTPSPEPGSYYYVDVDINGEITATDALDNLKHVVHLVTLTDETALELADVDHDEEVTAADAFGVLKVVVHLQEKESYTGN